MTDLEGVEIVLVEDDAGFRLVRSTSPQVLVTDISMPGRDGFWLFDEIRAQRDLHALPVVAVTAVANPARVLAKGFDACITKPVDPDAFCHSVGRALRDRSSRLRRAS